MSYTEGMFFGELALLKNEPRAASDKIPEARFDRQAADFSALTSLRRLRCPEARFDRYSAGFSLLTNLRRRRRMPRGAI